MKFILSLFLSLIFFYLVSAQSGIPEVNIRSISGKTTAFNQLTKADNDTAVVVSFWATWCIPCVAELDNINDELTDLQKQIPFKFYGVAVDDARTANRVKSFVKGKGWKFDVFQDLNSELKRALNITDIPHVIVIKNNQIVYRHTGYIAGEEDNLFEEIKKLK